METDLKTDYLRRQLAANLLRYAVQREIFCRSCGAVLDCRRAVLIDGGARGAALCCADCWNQAAGRMRTDFENLEVTDGRELAALNIL